ncbi:MAG: hypothetical protein WC028_19040 [Candidatus Obscuribacterales bacterium]
MSKPKHGSSGKSIAKPQDALDSELSSKISGWCEDCQCSHDPSPLLREWLDLRKSLDDKELLQQGWRWLKRNKSQPEAGSAIVDLIKIKPTANLLAIGDAWLRQYSDDDMALWVVVEMLPIAPSRLLRRIAGELLDQPEELLDLSEVSHLIWSIVKGPPHAGLFKKIEKLIVKFPHNLHWASDLTPFDVERNSSLDELLLLYLRLNVNNPKVVILSPLIGEPSIEILEACLSWMKAGGWAHEYMPSYIRLLLEVSSKGKQTLLPRALRFARAWVKANPANSSAGSIHAGIICATGSMADIYRAKQWHEQHKDSFSASAVLVALLELAYSAEIKADEYVVKEAKLLLRDEATRHKKQRLVGALVGVYPDEESTVWAKEEYRRLRPLEILIRLLKRAPDAESIAAAEWAYDRWKDKEDLEPEMIDALLSADPTNKLALRRARVWQKRSPKNKWIKAINLLILAVLALALNVLPVMASSELDPTAAKPQGYFYFPYPDCILGRVKAIEVQTNPKKSNKGCTEMTVEIEDVLRGSLKGGERPVFSFSEPLSEVFPGRSKDEILGSKFVLAFRLFDPYDGHRSICHLYSPFAKQKFSAVDVANLKAKLQFPTFPNSECVLLKVTQVRTKATSGGVGVKAVVEEVLLGDVRREFDKLVKQAGAKKIALDLFLQPAESPEAERELKKIRAGMRCILGFDSSQSDGNEIRLWNVTTPFPGQTFCNSDIERLRGRLRLLVENNAKLKDILQKRLEERWTVERIRKYCQPERRVAQPCQNLVCRNSFVLYGELYPSLKGELGDVSWYCGVDSNVPDQYSVNVERKTSTHGLTYPDHWILDLGEPGFSNYTEDEFNNDLVAVSLSNCARNYDSVHRETTKADLSGRVWGLTKAQVIKAQNGQVTAYSCVLSNGAKLVAELDQNLSIKSILIDGKPDKDWTKAVAEAAENIDILNRIDQGYYKRSDLKP